MPDGGVADTLPARGLAKGFDSMAATMRLAAQTGAVTDPDASYDRVEMSRIEMEREYQQQKLVLEEAKLRLDEMKIRLDAAAKMKAASQPKTNGGKPGASE